LDNFADRLVESIREKDSCLAVGIDPRPDMIPSSIRRRAETDAELPPDAAALRMFSFDLIDAVAPHVPAVKPQAAFFERYGWPGFRAYCEVVRHARDAGLLVICDVKRGDIGSTAEAYADAYLAEDAHIPADAVTINPYLGSDSVEPFIQRCNDGKGAFVLVRTSNPSAREFQDMTAEGRTLYEVVAEKVSDWGRESIGDCGYSSIGAVVGATFPDEAEKLRKLLPHAFFLMPGVGAQGASAEDIAPCFDNGGLGVLVAAARSVDYAYMQEPWAADFGEDDWQQASVAAVQQLNARLNAVRRAK